MSFQFDPSGAGGGDAGWSWTGRTVAAAILFFGITTILEIVFKGCAHSVVCTGIKNSVGDVLKNEAKTFIDEVDARRSASKPDLSLFPTSVDYVGRVYTIRSNGEIDNMRIWRMPMPDDRNIAKAIVYNTLEERAPYQIKFYGKSDAYGFKGRTELAEGDAPYYPDEVRFVYGNSVLELAFYEPHRKSQGKGHFLPCADTSSYKSIVRCADTAFYTAHH